MLSHPSLDTNLLQELRTQTREIHQRIEALPYHTALRNRDLNPISIISFLRCLAVIHRTVETELNSCTDSRVKSFSSMETEKSHLINKDLQLLDSETKPIVASAFNISTKLCRHLARNCEHAPMFLLGVLYVLEGSQNGGIYLKNMIAECLHTSANQLSYFGAYGADTSNQWAVFTHKLGSMECTYDESKQAIQGAQYAFDSFEKIINSLCPIAEGDLIYHASAINPEAGNHGMPQNQNEIEIAFSAGQNAWKQYPYLEARFRERGQRFTKSDSCWILNLYHLDASSIRNNVFWLRNLLALRGIPSVILESHMREILKQLRLKWPDRKLDFLAFEAAILDLNSIRTKQICSNDWHEWTEKYENLLQKSVGYKVPGAANLLISAWADESSGIINAFSVTQNWFTDPIRFSESWISTVQELAILLKGTQP